MLDVILFEVFKEEKEYFERYFSKKINAQLVAETIQESSFKFPPARLICIRTQSIIPTSWKKYMDGILTRSTGYDHLLTFRRRAKTNMPLGFLGDYCARAVAEQAFLMLLALGRKLSRQIKNFNCFDRDNLTGVELQGKRLLVVGVGAIGSQVVDIGKGLRMNVKGVDIVHRLRKLSYVSLLRGVRWADAIACALPLTKKTKGLLNYALLKKARPGCILINISRGEITPLKDLKRLLKEKILGGLGLDVFSDEEELAPALRKKRRGASAKLIQRMHRYENVVFTPHNAFNTKEALERKSSETAKAIEYFLKHKTFLQLVPKA